MSKTAEVDLGVEDLHLSEELSYTELENIALAYELEARQYFREDKVQQARIREGIARGLRVVVLLSRATVDGYVSHAAVQTKVSIRGSLRGRLRRDEQEEIMQDVSLCVRRLQANERIARSLRGRSVVRA